MKTVNCIRCDYRHKDNGNCTAVGGFCTAVPAAHCPMLREYLDTGLTPAEVSAPIVRCKDCEYSYDEINYLCCSHGVCFDCEVPPNFYCAEGKRKENDE